MDTCCPKHVENRNKHKWKICASCWFIYKDYLHELSSRQHRQITTQKSLPFIVSSVVCTIIIININDWTIWSVPFPELQLLTPTFLRSSNCSPSLWSVVVWFQKGCRFVAFFATVETSSVCIHLCQLLFDPKQLCRWHIASQTACLMTVLRHPLRKVPAFGALDNGRNPHEISWYKAQFGYEYFVLKNAVSVGSGYTVTCGFKYFINRNVKSGHGCQKLLHCVLPPT